jgi:hypothetical protein
MTSHARGEARPCRISREGIPSTFLFRTGGDQTVRGYAFESLGVRQGDAVLGGRYLFIGSIEYTHWFAPAWGLAVFADGGNAWDTGSFDPVYGLGGGVPRSGGARRRRHGEPKPAPAIFRRFRVLIGHRFLKGGAARRPGASCRAGCGWLLGTESGLRWALGFAPADLKLEEPRGTLMGTISFERVAFQGSEARKVAFDLSLLALLADTISVEFVDQACVRNPRPKTSNRRPSLFASASRRTGEVCGVQGYGTLASRPRSAAPPRSALPSRLARHMKASIRGAVGVESDVRGECGGPPGGAANRAQHQPQGREPRHSRRLHFNPERADRSRRCRCAPEAAFHGHDHRLRLVATDAPAGSLGKGRQASKVRRSSPVSNSTCARSTRACARRSSPEGWISTSRPSGSG